MVRQSLAESDRGDNDRAIATANEAIRLNPNYANAFVARGLAYLKKGDNDRAIADFNEAVRRSPMYAQAFCARGKAKLAMNEASGNADIAKARALDASICP